MPDMRAPIDPAYVQRLLGPDSPFTVRQVSATGSTNADLAAAAVDLPHGTVLTAEEQLAGRGRLDRTWSCPGGAGLMFSVLLRLPQVPVDRLGWTGAVLGIATVRGIGRAAGIACGLKWPNDVLVGDAKCAGILAEMTAGAVVVGAGINVSLRRDELPRSDATSLQLAGAGEVDRAVLLAAILGEFGSLVECWQAAAGDVDTSGLRGAYRRMCVTLGRRVRLRLPRSAAVTGRAADVDESGALLVDVAGRTVAYSAGDVVHIRPA